MMREDGVWGAARKRSWRGSRTRNAARCRRGPGSNASSAIPMWCAPRARASLARGLQARRNRRQVSCAQAGRARGRSRRGARRLERDRGKARRRRRARDRARHSRHEADRRGRISQTRFSRCVGAGVASRPCSAAKRTSYCRTWRPMPPAIGRPTICASWRLPRRRPIFAREVLAHGGVFLCKVLQGGTETTLLAELKRDFESVKHVKPPASRTNSAELYLLARGFRHHGRTA